MTIVNRRNALVGWVMLKMWKRNARRKAKQGSSKLTSLRRKTD